MTHTTHHMDEQGVTIWFTGLSGAGKSTLAEMLFHELRKRDMKVELLDGDVVRTNLSKGLGFSKEDRDTNILRIGFVANLLTRNGVVTIVSAISPYRDARNQCRALIRDFVEVHVHVSKHESVDPRLGEHLGYPPLEDDCTQGLQKCSSAGLAAREVTGGPVAAIPLGGS